MQLFIEEKKRSAAGIVKYLVTLDSDIPGNLRIRHKGNNDLFKKLRLFNSDYFTELGFEPRYVDNFDGTFRLLVEVYCEEYLYDTILKLCSEASMMMDLIKEPERFALYEQA